jgi:hypothetical protein
LIREQQVVGRDYWDYPPQHVLRWTRPALSALLTRHGWQVEQVVEEPFSWVAAASQIAAVRATYRGELHHALWRRLSLLMAWLRLLNASDELRHGVSLYVKASQKTGASL